MRRRVRFMTSRASPTGISGSRRERTAEKRGQSWEPSENFKDSEYVDEDEDENGNIVSEANEDFLFTGEPVMPSGPTVSSVPDLFTSAPPIRDQLKTATSDSQDATVDQCLPLLSGDEADGASPSDLNSHGLPKLDRRKHIKFLHTSLGKLPSGFVGLDATRPWMLYWALTGLFLLGEEVSQYRERVIATLSPMQNPDGGFGGGHGQMSHCAASYAAVLSLILVGGEEAWETIDRKTL
ncbi:MAG: CAAX farnesyltransferase (FTase) subunit beta [Sclerophora amabilis]|nr:MAG: CAAX farnesyltransferase (FTase) subunit beta [Sclerophora amabilis]